MTWLADAARGYVVAAALIGGVPSAVSFAIAEDAPPCAAQELATSEGCAPAAEAAGRIEVIVQSAIAERKLKAAIVGISIDGARVMERAWGESMTGVRATPEMHFRNGAIAIAYIGTVLLRLQQQGILSLDDKLSEWFPDYPKADQITLRMLMNCTSGYADYVNLDVLPLYDDPFRHWYAEELVEIGLSQPMLCEPGECWSYAHTNFVILGLAMERATGRRLDELIEEGILIPLALSGTRSEETAIIPEPVLHAFAAERDTYEESTFWNPSWTLAQGAIMTTTIADVLTSAEAIGEGWLLSPESHAAQLEPLTAGFAPWSDDVYYGLGVFSINGWIVQNPSFHGYAATMAYLPARKLALAVTVTLDPGASLEGNLSTDVLKEIAAYLAPDAPF